MKETRSNLWKIIHSLKINSALVMIIFFSLSGNGKASASELHIGTATADISPGLPIALDGQFHMRIAHSAATPLTANVVALESREGGKSLDLAIMVSCDLVGIPKIMLEKVRNEVHKGLPTLDVNKIFLSAIHTHTAPVVDNSEDLAWGYPIPKKGVTQVDEYQDFFAKRVAEAVVNAWNNRSPGSMTWGHGYAVTSYNRRASYENGTSAMYGKTNTPAFQSFEGYEDHDVNTLFFWNSAGKLIAMNIEMASPAQEVEHDTTVNADYWHPVRLALQEKYGKDLVVLGWCGAAGDQSPHLMYRRSADERMRKLRNLSRLDEIARRVVNAVNETYETVKDDRHSDVKLVHKVEKLTLPAQLVTEEQYLEAKAISKEAEDQIRKNPEAASQVMAKMKWYGGVVKRYENQKTNLHPAYEMELHVLRIGDVAVCTNEFELYTDYGIRMQAQSKALQTFVIQLTGPGTYLPTAKAVKAGSYSAIIESFVVGPEGGQILVDRTVELINGLWPEKNMTSNQFP